MARSNANAIPTTPQPGKARLASLDALRGFDIFMLVFFDEIAWVFRQGPAPRFTEQTEFWSSFWRPLGAFLDVPTWAEKSRCFCEWLMTQTVHTGWNQGFSILDELMPLFLFMAGAAIPFALARYLTGERRRNVALWIRILRRVVVLWIFGMCVQGNLLTLDPGQFKLYSNTLQSIATGYFFSCLAYLYLPRWGRYALFVALLAAFWGVNKFCVLNGCGGGSYEPNTNIAYEIDRMVLGRFRDGAQLDENGAVVYNAGYMYTWILSSLTFVATTLSGLFAGEILYHTRERVAAEGDAPRRRKAQYGAFATVAILGVAFILLGRLWDAAPEGSFVYCPIVKYIWTPSMVLFSSGISLALLAGFYLIFDVWKCWFLKTFFLVWGANAIAAYMLSHLVHYGEFAGWFLYGLEQFVGDWQDTINHLVGAMLLWLFLWDFWRRGKFLRV